MPENKRMAVVAALLSAVVAGFALWNLLPETPPKILTLSMDRFYGGDNE